MSVARLHISLWVSWVQLFTYLYEYYFFYLPSLSEYFYRHSTSIPSTFWKIFHNKVSHVSVTKFFSHTRAKQYRGSVAYS
jgi:hypothetical protein